MLDIVVVAVVLVLVSAPVFWATSKLLARMNRDLGRPPLRELLRQTAPIRREQRRKNGVRFLPWMLVAIAVGLAGYSLVVLSQHG